MTERGDACKLLRMREEAKRELHRLEDQSMDYERQRRLAEHLQRIWAALCSQNLSPTIGGPYA